MLHRIITLTITIATISSLLPAMAISNNPFPRRDKNKFPGGAMGTKLEMNYIVQVTEKKIYVILFNAHSKNEGIHTIKTKNRNKILMFESQQDAQSFLNQLIQTIPKNRNIPKPSLEYINYQDIVEFCKESGYDYQLILPGTLVEPILSWVDTLDYQPWENQQRSKHRSYSTKL